MTPAELLTDCFGRIAEGVPAVLDGLADDQLALRIDGSANSVAWLVWHLTRVQDDHVADAFGTEQVWLADGWHERFGLPLEPADTGYGHGFDQVAAVRASGTLLAGYHAAVFARTRELLADLTPEQLDEVIDERWTPPVTRGVRLVSVFDDDAKHLGQAEFVRGLLPG
ncbi:mycothiol transferase [Pseudonocardia xishanensis]|uniref:DinB family protein n=1 Tax=Pseudonocardia xishanensis TaxID=630995 RepID=A0ABP8RYD3_9PSEU